MSWTTSLAATKPIWTANPPPRCFPPPQPPIRLPDRAVNFYSVGEQHGGEGDPPTGGAAEDLGLLFQASGSAVPAAAGHLPDVPLPGKVVPQVPAVKGNRLGLVPADSANSILIRRRYTEKHAETACHQVIKVQRTML